MSEFKMDDMTFRNDKRSRDRNKKHGALGMHAGPRVSTWVRTGLVSLTVGTLVLLLSQNTPGGINLQYPYRVSSWLISATMVGNSALS